MDVMQLIGDRTGYATPLTGFQGSLDPGFPGGLGTIAPGIIPTQGDGMGGLGSDGSGRTAIVIAGAIIVSLVGFHLWTRNF